MLVPTEPKIYHMIHVDRLASVIAEGGLLCDAIIRRRGAPGTTIGLNTIKQRRLDELILSNHPKLHVGDCVPFYFCPRSIMLYKIWKANDPELEYKGGQGAIVHLQADLRQAVSWANSNSHRWAFTSSNAGSYYFRDYSDLNQLDKINWEAVHADRWSGPDVDPALKEGKQAEFLIEGSFSWELVSRIGIRSQNIYANVQNALQRAHHRPTVEVKPDWYY